MYTDDLSEMAWGIIARAAQVSDTLKTDLSARIGGYVAFVRLQQADIDGSLTGFLNPFLSPADRTYGCPGRGMNSWDHVNLKILDKVSIDTIINAKTIE
jgi:hypothetical protein